MLNYTSDPKSEGKKVALGDVLSYAATSISIKGRRGRSGSGITTFSSSPKNRIRRPKK